MNISWDFASAIYHARMKRGLSQEKVAELAGISTGWYQQVEKGGVNASLDICARIAAVLDIDLNQFIPGRMQACCTQRVQATVSVPKQTRQICRPPMVEIGAGSFGAKRKPG